MKCPLVCLCVAINHGTLDGPQGDCLQARCAWWIDGIQMCCVKDIALELGYTQQRLCHLVEAVKEKRTR
ncbi:MAG: hypothetical protein V1849_01070 [Chloroflexota bacterium]